MNIKDAINIVKGTNNAGTDYLYENTNLMVDITDRVNNSFSMSLRRESKKDLL